MTFWSSIQQIVSDAGTSISNVSDSARKLVGRGESQDENDDVSAAHIDSRSRTTNPSRPGCPLVVPDTTDRRNSNVGVGGPDSSQNSFGFAQLVGTTKFLRRVSSQSSSSNVVSDSSSTPQRTGSLVAAPSGWMSNQSMKSNGNSSLSGGSKSSMFSSAADRFTSISSGGSSGSGDRGDDVFRRANINAHQKRKSPARSTSRKPSCFMEMPQRWAELTETRSG